MQCMPAVGAVGTALGLGVGGLVVEGIVVLFDELGGLAV